MDIQEKILRKANVEAPNLGNVSGRKCMWTSYALSVFSSITWPLPLYKRSNIKKDKQNKIMALFVHYHYKREVYCERTV